LADKGIGRSLVVLIALVAPAKVATHHVFWPLSAQAA
jgi:hypothetical protein